MDSGNKLFRESQGRQITVYYNDTSNSVSFKTGTLIDFDGFSLKLQENDTIILIPHHKCIRIELGRREQHEQTISK